MREPRPRILVSNDDGYLAEGLQTLVDAVAPLGEVWVVAPENEQSAASHAISLHRPLRIRDVRERWFAVDGTPADCTYLAVHHLLKDRPPDLVVSGINHGANLADDVTYSGTVAAAREAALNGVPAIAFSLAKRGDRGFEPAGRFARAFVREAIERRLPAGALLSVNVPPGDPQEFEVTRLGKHSYGFEVIENVDPRGRKYYWIGGSSYTHEDIPGSDCRAVVAGRISVTPLHFDLTHRPMISPLGAWRPEGFEARETSPHATEPVSTDEPAPRRGGGPGSPVR